MYTHVVKPLAGCCSDTLLVEITTANLLDTKPLVLVG